MDSLDFRMQFHCNFTSKFYFEVDIRVHKLDLRVYEANVFVLKEDVLVRSQNPLKFSYAITVFLNFALSPYQ